MPNRSLKRVSLLFIVVLLLWPVLVVLITPRGNVTSQLFQLSAHFWPHFLIFSVALLIAPLLLMMLYFFIRSLDEPINRISLWLATLFYLLYFTLATISYGSQVLFKWLFMTPKMPMSTLLNWFFYENQSLVYFINQSGYLAFSVATLILFIPLCQAKNSFFKTINLLMIISSLLQITATLALFFDIPFLNNLTVLSGLMLLPVGIMIYKYNKKNTLLAEEVMK